MSDPSASERPGIWPVVGTALRLLTFRASAEELRGLNWRHLALGLACTWIVGVGRWWEDPRVGLLQHLGLGSVVYVFVLALFLWAVVWPLGPANWSYLKVLSFVALTSPPGILYAIPVRHGLTLQSAQAVCLCFLAVVAGWRVLLLGFFLRRGAGLSGFRSLLATVFPLTLIVFVLTSLNLEKVVFDAMGGIKPENRTVNDGAYGVLVLITMISVLLFVPLLITYLVMSTQALVRKFRR